MKIKRIFDLTCAFLGVIFLSPFYILISIWIKLDSPGPIFFIQKRVGKQGASIDVYKFRTMVVDAESIGLKITVGRDPRVTKSGNFLRKYKLDEIPQLFNVLNGTMSLVGPRPEVREYIDIYPRLVRDKVLSVKPGMTDLASIEFRHENELLEKSSDPHRTYIDKILPQKQQYYMNYVDSQSVFLDLKIIFKTIFFIFK